MVEAVGIEEVGEIGILKSARNLKESARGTVH